MTASADETAVGHLLDRYIDALYAGSAEALGDVFHPEGIYATAQGGDLLRLAIPDYLTLVAGRAKPDDRREAAIDAIEVVGGTMAFARLRCTLFQRDYVDFLTLLKTEGRWWVMAKLFHYDERRN